VSEEKPFDPTPSRLERARREGDVARSQELAAAVSFAGGALAVAALIPSLAAAARAALESAAASVASSSEAQNAAFGSASRVSLAPGPYAELAICVAAVMLAAIGGAVAATFAQGGIAVRALAVSFEKLNPAEGLKRMFSREALLSAGKALLAAAAGGLAALPALRDAFGAGASPEQLAGLALHAAANIAASVVAIGLLFGALDTLAERARRLRRLRMSFDELRRDHKEQDGDPQLRGRRRQAHRSLIRGSLARVAEASFVVTNPTHVAIALAYRPPEIAVPQVLVRAVDDGAEAVKRRARELGIPLFENVSLARLLLARCEVESFIPVEAYVAAAEIVAALAAAERRAP
jgi:flagellar biosynthesis protein FlhB